MQLDGSDSRVQLYVDKLEITEFLANSSYVGQFPSVAKPSVYIERTSPTNTVIILDNGKFGNAIGPSFGVLSICMLFICVGLIMDVAMESSTGSNQQVLTWLSCTFYLVNNVNTFKLMALLGNFDGNVTIVSRDGQVPTNLASDVAIYPIADSCMRASILCSIIMQNIYCYDYNLKQQRAIDIHGFESVCQ